METMENTLERKMKAHERGVAVLGKLAVSFGVEVCDADRERWLTLLALSREIDEAWLTKDLHPGPCHEALLAGKAYGQSIPVQLSARFKALYETSDNLAKEKLDGFVRGIVRHNAQISGQSLDRSDVVRSSIDHKRKIGRFQAALEADAKYRAEILALPLVGAPEDEMLYRGENANRVRYNAWLEDFYVAYEHLGALAHVERDLKIGRHSVDTVGGQWFSQAGLASRSLFRCLAHGTPRASLTLLTHGAARVGRKMIGRL